MGLANCANCGILINSKGKLDDLCPQCLQQQEQTFRIIREQIRKQPGQNLQELARDTGIPVHKIMNWIREGRIQTM